MFSFVQTFIFRTLCKSMGQTNDGRLVSSKSHFLRRCSTNCQESRLNEKVHRHSCHSRLYFADFYGPKQKKLQQCILTHLSITLIEIPNSFVPEQNYWSYYSTKKHLMHDYIITYLAINFIFDLQNRELEENPDCTIYAELTINKNHNITCSHLPAVKRILGLGQHS